MDRHQLGRQIGNIFFQRHVGRGIKLQITTSDLAEMPPQMDDILCRLREIDKDGHAENAATRRRQQRRGSSQD
jgi:hypothetical protein